MVIRTAVAEDAEAIAAVHVASWQGAYRGQFPDKVLDGLDVAQRAAGWRRHLEQDGQVSLPAGVTVSELRYRRELDLRPGRSGH